MFNISMFLTVTLHTTHKGVLRDITTSMVKGELAKEYVGRNEVCPSAGAKEDGRESQYRKEE